MITQFTKCLLATLLSLGLAACGLKGPLYMPPPPEQLQSQSAPPATSSATPAAATEATGH